MGRYYGGDIEGKFWFAVQGSDDGEFFGAYEEQDIQYEVSGEDESVQEVDDRIEECLVELGDARKHIEKFFEDNPTYTDERLNEFLNKQGTIAWDLPETKALLIWYARLEMGYKIKRALVEAGGDSIHFWAEC